MRRGDMWLRDIAVVTDDPGEEIKAIEFLVEVPGEGKARLRVELDQVVEDVEDVLAGGRQDARLIAYTVELAEPPFRGH